MIGTQIAIDFMYDSHDVDFLGQLSSLMKIFEWDLLKKFLIGFYGMSCPFPLTEMSPSYLKVPVNLKFPESSWNFKLICNLKYEGEPVQEIKSSQLNIHKQNII